VSKVSAAEARPGRACTTLTDSRSLAARDGRHEDDVHTHGGVPLALVHLTHVLGREHARKQEPVALATDPEAIRGLLGDLEA
jgi:hypothetical protein